MNDDQSKKIEVLRSRKRKSGFSATGADALVTGPVAFCARLPDSADVRVEKLKYMIWAQSLPKSVSFYQQVFGAKVLHQSDVMAELEIAGGIVGIHGGGEGKRTWTGLNFQVDDLFAACDALAAAGGQILRPPVDTPQEPAHLAMCVDPDGNEIMITRRRT